MERKEILQQLKSNGIRFPIAEISRSLKISKAMVSMWFSGKRDSKKIQDHINQLLEKVN